MGRHFFDLLFSGRFYVSGDWAFFGGRGMVRVLRCGWVGCVDDDLGFGSKSHSDSKCCGTFHPPMIELDNNVMILVKKMLRLGRTL